MIAFAKDFIAWAHWALLVQRLGPVTNQFAVSLSGNEFHLAITVEVSNAGMARVSCVAGQTVVPDRFSLQAS